MSRARGTGRISGPAGGGHRLFSPSTGGPSRRACRRSSRDPPPGRSVPARKGKRRTTSHPCSFRRATSARDPNRAHRVPNREQVRARPASISPWAHPSRQSVVQKGLAPSDEGVGDWQQPSLAGNLDNREPDPLLEHDQGRVLRECEDYARSRGCPANDGRLRRRRNAARPRLGRDSLGRKVDDPDVRRAVHRVPGDPPANPVIDESGEDDRRRSRGVPLHLGQELRLRAGRAVGVACPRLGRAEHLVPAALQGALEGSAPAPPRHSVAVLQRDQEPLREVDLSVALGDGDAFPAQNLGERHRDDPDIQPEAPVVHVPRVQK
jgi:hypothetical protein